jgi:hypothetical protein
MSRSYLGVLLLVAFPALAGTVNMLGDANTNITANISVNSPLTQKADPANQKPPISGRGRAIFDFGTPEQEKAIKLVTFTFTLNGKEKKLEVKLASALNPQGDLFAFVPFELPVFDSSLALVYIVDAPAFQASPTFFLEGEQVQVQNGIILGTPAILFKDASSVTGSLADLTESQADALPTFTGLATVSGFAIGVEPIPEPGTLILLSCLAGLPFALRRRRG